MKRAVVAVALSLFIVSPLAQADTPRGTYMHVPDAEVLPQTHGGSFAGLVLYLNSCLGGQNCTFTSGLDNSITNRSRIPQNGTATMTPWDLGDAAWDQFMTCMAAMYEPYGVEVTDIDPGNVSHHEAVVAGFPQDVGLGNGIGGIAPFSCGVINNAITFSFANIYSSAQEICHTAAQESAHAFGLEHEFHCPDPMTYLNGCGAKTFKDFDAQCGEFSARSCDCGGNTQNSHQQLLSLFGNGTPSPPTVTFIRPMAGESVPVGYAIEITAVDNVAVERVELFINGQMVLESSLQPYIFNAPATLTEGTQDIEVRAYDNAGTMGSATITVNQGPPCDGNGDCGDGEVCLAGRCLPGPDQEGGLGADCTNNDQCNSEQCGSDGENQYCTQPCVNDECPSGFQCISAGGDAKVCWPGGGDDSGGCSVGSPGPALPVGVAIFFAVVIFGRRRRT